jgi:hypothetical protein
MCFISRGVDGMDYSPPTNLLTSRKLGEVSTVFIAFRSLYIVVAFVVALWDLMEVIGMIEPTLFKLDEELVYAFTSFTEYVENKTTAIIILVVSSWIGLLLLSMR